MLYFIWANAWFLDLIFKSVNSIVFYIMQGLLSTTDDRRLVIQGVQELYDSFYTTPWDSPEDRINRIVFIGEIFLTFSPEIIQFLLTFYLELFPFLLPPNITNAIV